jgi:hypothetical protein
MGGREDDELENTAVSSIESKSASALQISETPHSKLGETWTRCFDCIIEFLNLQGVVSHYCLVGWDIVTSDL